MKRNLKKYSYRTKRQRSRRVISAFLAFLLLTLCLLPVNAAASDDAASSQNKVVKIGWYHSDLFQEGMADGEEKSGYCYEYIHKVSDYNGWTYEYVYGDWTELLQKLMTGEIDVLAGVSKTDERMDKLLYPDEVMGYEHYVLYQHQGGGMDASDISTFKGKKIGAITDNLMTDYLEDWLENSHADAEIVYYDSFEDRDKDFDEGKIDGLVTTNNGVLTSSGYAQVAEVGKESYYLAVSKGREDILSDLNRALSYMDDIEPYFITNLEYENYGTTLANSTLSSAEESWLAEHDTLTIGCFENYLPYSAVDDDGNITGLITDVMDAILKELDIEDRLNVTYKAYASGSELQQALKDHEIDAAFPVSGSTWQLEQDGISATNDVVTSFVELAYTGDYSDEKTARIAVARGNALSRSYVERVFPDAEIIECDSIEGCLQGVLIGAADSTLINGLRTDIIKQNRKYNSVNLKQLDQTDSRAIGITNENTGLHMLLNRGLRLIGTNYGSNAAFNYMGGLYQDTVNDFIFDHVWFFVGIFTLIIALILIIALRHQAASRKILKLEEEKNAALSEKQKELADARDQADAANRAKTTFLFNMSHDIRTPMNAIMGFRDLLEKHQDDPEKRQDYLNKIKNASTSLLSIINNVLEMARIEKGSMEIEETAQDLEQFCDSLYSFMQDMMEEKGLKFTKSVSVRHKYVLADAVKLREVFINILSNAYKYTNTGGSVDMQVEELVSDREDMVVYRTTISDTGIGMSEEFLPHIFEEFSREQNTTAARIEGTGLGMPIVKNLVDMMGGTIEVTSKKGEGTCFTVTLSHRIASEKDLPGSEAKEAGTETFTGKRILLAEDNDLNAEIAIEILTETGFTVERAEDGKICLEMLESRAPGYYDLILMDIQMPNMNGYEATRAIRKLPDPVRAGIKIFAMTANAFAEDRQEAFDAGMDGHLAKPVDIEVMMQTLKEALG